MLRKIIALAVVFGVVIAEPVAKLSSVTTDGLDTDTIYTPSVAIEKKSEQELGRLLPEGTYLFLDAVSALAGYKFTAISFGVLAIEWLISNIIVIFIGAAAAVGICKITGKCNLNYEAYVPVAQLKNWVTPEYLATAEKFFVSAMEKYAEKKARAAESRPWYF